MKRLLMLIGLLALLLSTPAPAQDNDAGTGAPGHAGTNRVSSPSAAENIATNTGAVNSIGTNLSTERAANRAITRAATNSQSSGTPAFFGPGTGTGRHGPIFWFYVALDVAFLVWLVLAIWHRVQVRKARSQ